MLIAARTLFALAAISFWGGCRQVAKTPPAAPPPAAAAPATSASTPPPRIAPGTLAPSPRLIVGRIIAIDAARGFAFVELVSDFPQPATDHGTELVSRTPQLQETGALRASRYARGRTLGTTILGGKPAVGDEVVWLAP